MTTPPSSSSCDAATSGSQGQRLLESRIAELEAEVAELRLAAERARDVAAAATATRAADLRSIRALDGEVEELRARLVKRQSVRSFRRIAHRLSRRGAADG